MKKISYLIIALLSIFAFNFAASAQDIKSDVLIGDIDKMVQPYILDVSGQDYFQICDSSKNPQLVASFKLVGIFVTIVKIIVPVILIILGSIDMSKAVISKDNDAIQKSLMVFFKRAAAGVLVFLAPNIILGIFHLVDGMDNFDSAYQTCVDCILGSSSCPDVSFGNVSNNYGNESSSSSSGSSGGSSSKSNSSGGSSNFSGGGGSHGF